MDLTDSPFFTESPIAIYTCNRQGIITTYNRAAAQLWGREPVIGLDVWCGAWRAYNLNGSIMEKEQYPLFIALTNKQVANQLEMVVERPDRTRRRLLVYPTLIGHGATITGASAHLIDVTYKDEQEIRHTFLSSIVQSSDDAIISKNLDGIITSWNNGACQMFGFTEDEVIGKPITILIPQDRMDEEPHILGQIRTGQKVDHFQTVRLSKTGEEIHISLSVSPVRDHTGRVIGASKIARDITRQVKAEKAIRLYASNLEAINSIGKSIAKKLDVSNIMQFVAESATELIGATYGAFYYDTTNEDGDPITLHAFAGTLMAVPADHNSLPAGPWPVLPTRRLAMNLSDLSSAGPVPTALDVRLPHIKRQGTASYLQVPVLSPDDQMVGELFFGHPQPGKFHGHHEELIASIAAQAAIALGNSKLFEEVSTLSKKKDVFIALASHELKTPLTSVGGFLQIVAKKTVDPLSRKFIGKAINQVSKLNKLVADLLDAARLGNTRLPTHMEPVDCRQLLMDIIENFRHAHPDNTIHLDGGEGDMTAVADKQRMGQVFVNLLDNAIKYSSSADAVLVRIVNEETHLKITIKDEGIGMDEKQQKGLFTRFYRVENEAANVPGLGLGLYLSKQIIDAHGGELTCRSTLKKGSVFTITLPKTR